VIQFVDIVGRIYKRGVSTCGHGNPGDVIAMEDGRLIVERRSKKTIILP